MTTLTEFGRLVQPQFPFCTLEAKPKRGRHPRHQFWDRDSLEPGAWDLDVLQVGQHLPLRLSQKLRGQQTELSLCPQPPSLAAAPRPLGNTRGLLSTQLLLSDLSLAASAWPLPPPHCLFLSEVLCLFLPPPRAAYSTGDVCTLLLSKCFLLVVEWTDLQSPASIHNLAACGSHVL